MFEIFEKNQTFIEFADTYIYECIKNNPERMTLISAEYLFRNYGGIISCGNEKGAIYCTYKEYNWIYIAFRMIGIGYDIEVDYTVVGHIDKESNFTFIFNLCDVENDDVRKYLTARIRSQKLELLLRTLDSICKQKERDNLDGFYELFIN